MTVMIQRARKSSRRARWTIAALGLSLSARGPRALAARGDGEPPAAPAAADGDDRAERLRLRSPGAGHRHVDPDGDEPASRRTAITRARATSTRRDTPARLVIHANAESDPKELTLDISGSHNVFDGLIDSRSHLKIGGSWNLCGTGRSTASARPGRSPSTSRAATTASARSRRRPYEEAPPASPSGFPFDGAFDPDKDGNVLEHFAPGRRRPPTRSTTPGRSISTSTPTPQGSRSPSRHSRSGSTSSAASRTQRVGARPRPPAAPARRLRDHGPQRPGAGRWSRASTSSPVARSSPRAT